MLAFHRPFIHFCLYLAKRLRLAFDNGAKHKNQQHLLKVLLINSAENHKWRWNSQFSAQVINITEDNFGRNGNLTAPKYHKFPSCVAINRIWLTLDQLHFARYESYIFLDICIMHSRNANILKSFSIFFCSKWKHFDRIFYEEDLSISQEWSTHTNAIYEILRGRAHNYSYAW